MRAPTHKHGMHAAGGVRSMCGPCVLLLVVQCQQTMMVQGCVRELNACRRNVCLSQADKLASDLICNGVEAGVCVCVG